MHIRFLDFSLLSCRRIERVNDQICVLKKKLSYSSVTRSIDNTVMNLIFISLIWVKGDMVLENGLPNHSWCRFEELQRFLVYFSDQLFVLLYAALLRLFLSNKRQRYYIRLFSANN